MNSKVWQFTKKSIRETLKETFQEAELDRWIGPLEFMTNDTNQQTTVIAPNEYFAELLQSRVIWQELCQIFLNVGSKLPILSCEKKGQSNEHNIPLKKEKITSIDTDNSLLDRSKRRTPLKKNKYYTFDNFVEGKSNKLVLSVAKTVAEKENQETIEYNPLFVYGDSGNGKTHLLYAIKNKIESEAKSQKVMYLQASDFVNRLVSAISQKTTDQFKSLFNAQDVLLIDDVEFFAGKKSSMEEFFQLINNFIDNSKQIVLSSDRMPTDMEMPDRIRSRLASGLAMPIIAPDFEHRVLIIQQKATELKIELDEKSVYWLANKAQVCVRELIGFINSLKAHIEYGFCPDKITLSHISQILLPTLAAHQIIVTPEKILDQVCEYYALRRNEITSKIRRKPLVVARQMAMYVMKQLTPHSLTEIGSYFNRDHTTVLHGINKVTEIISDNKTVEADFQNIVNRLKSRNKE